MISVVIPTYNRAGKLERAMRSVLEQGTGVDELIVVDDASTDATADVVRSIDDPRLTFLQHDVNRGGQTARNTGIRATTGEWIAFLDSDDYWLPESLALRFAEAERSGADVIHSAALVTYDGKNQVEFPAIKPLRGRVYEALLGEPGPMFQGLLVKKSALEKIGLLDEMIRSFQEWDTAIRLAQHFEFAYVETPTFVYDCSGADAMSKDALKDIDGYRQIVAKHRQAVLGENGRAALARHMDVIGRKYLTIGLRRYAYPYLFYGKLLRFLA